MFVNACPDSGQVTFFLNDEDLSGALSKREYTGLVTFPFISAADGAYDVSLEEPDRSIAYDTQAQFFDHDTTTIMVAIGLKNPVQGEELKRLREIFVTPDRTAPIGDTARLFIVHAFNRKQGFQTPKLILQNFGDQPKFQSTNMSYGGSATMDVDSGQYVTDHQNPANDNHWIAKDPDNDQVYCENPDVTLKPGALYLVICGGLEDPNPLVRQNIQFIEVPVLVP